MTYFGFTAVKLTALKTSQDYPIDDFSGFFFFFFFFLPVDC